MFKNNLAEMVSEFFLKLTLFLVVIGVGTPILM